MAIPNSGPLCLRATINQEVEGNSTDNNVSLRNLSSTAGFSSPDAMSEFYGYDPVTMDFLVLAAGASGAEGGGGSGGMRVSYGSTSGRGCGAEDGITLSAGTYQIAIGAGGVPYSPRDIGNPQPLWGCNGTNSYICFGGSPVICSRGGGGGTLYGAPFPTNRAPGQSGGSGGGGMVTGFYNDQGSAGGGGGTGCQGFNGGGVPGGNGRYNASQGGGGGGVGASGGVPSNSYSLSQPSSGPGGSGLSISITGTGVTYGGGGAGNCNVPNVQGVPGGSGGGGCGGYYQSANGGGQRGGGGGGGMHNNNCNTSAGGSGLVVLRIPTCAYSGTTTGSPTVTTSGTDTILQYTGAGTYVHS